MAVPPVTSPCWRWLANGGLFKIQTSCMSTQMLAKRLQLSSTSLDDKIKEIFAYYTKFERGLADEIAQFS